MKGSLGVGYLIEIIDISYQISRFAIHPLGSPVLCDADTERNVMCTRYQIPNNIDPFFRFSLSYRAR